MTHRKYIQFRIDLSADAWKVRPPGMWVGCNPYLQNRPDLLRSVGLHRGNHQKNEIPLGRTPGGRSSESVAC